MRVEIAPFGIRTTLVNPGFFRTELLTKDSTIHAERSIDDYADHREEQARWWESQNGQQSGDPAKLAEALITIAGRTEGGDRRLSRAVHGARSRRGSTRRGITLPQGSNPGRVSDGGAMAIRIPSILGKLDE